MAQKIIDTTRDAAKPAPGKTPPLPHERDESVGTTAATPNERIVQGRRDLQRGVQDTSRAPESERAYERQKRS